MMRKRMHGLTMVELLVTTALMAMIGAATVAALSGGLRVWQRASEYGSSQQGAVITLERLRLDVQSARWSALAPPKGRYDEFAFGAVETLSDAADGLPEIGRLGYYHDSAHAQLCRSFVPYRLMKRERLRERCQVVLDEVRRVRFRYQPRAPNGKAGRWQESWDDPQLPATVKVELELGPRSSTATALSLLIPIMAQAPEPKEDADER